MKALFDAIFGSYDPNILVFWLSIVIILNFVCIIFYQTLKKNAALKEENADLNFYKSQLSEIEKDIAKGAIGAEEAEQVKVEISRRILKSKNQSFLIEPKVRFSGQAGEQRTMFLQDPSGNALEFKAFKNLNSLFQP